MSVHIDQVGSATQYNREVLSEETRRLFSGLQGCESLEHARNFMLEGIHCAHERTARRSDPRSDDVIRVRDCALALTSILGARSDRRCGFSAAKALWDVVQQVPRDDLQPGFCAELINWMRGLQGRAPYDYLGHWDLDPQITGREAALARSSELDRLWSVVEAKMARFGNGLSEESRARRKSRRRHVAKVLGATEADWNDWRWHIRHLVTDEAVLGRLVELGDDERDDIASALRARLPFAITPYYVSLMDERKSDRDRAVRAQVIPTCDYVEWMSKHRDSRGRSCDFMLESDTSPVDLVTRRYPAIVIFKPYIACPQVCVYCQRNWEIEQAMSPGAMADEDAVEAAIQWIREHRAIREVLLTGGDPLMLADEQLRRLLSRIADIPHVDMIRLGTRTPVTLPMRITDGLASMLAEFRAVGRRDVAVVTHIEHAYEVTQDTAGAVDRLRRNGIAVYNQHVFTFHVSRRFESAMLRMLLRPIGVDPYYTFVPKGKEETNSYRVPIARLMQEQKEEARLMPGLRRTDEVVYNVPGLGKNYLRALQHRDLVTVLPDGSRMYEFHPWEKNLTSCETHLASDVPILDYLQRLAAIGEDPADYDSIWFYF